MSCVKILFGVGVLASLQGCILAPGMDINEMSWRLHGPDSVRAPGLSSTSGVVEVQLITEELIAGQLAEQQQARSLEQAALQELFEPNEQDTIYRVGINDVLSIVIWGQPELVASGGAGNSPLVRRQVRGDGTFFFPYIGVTKALGKTREEIRSELTRRLDQYFNAPQVDVAIEDYLSQSISLTGEFNRPSVIPLTGEPLTLAQAIAEAGGPNSDADLRDIRLQRAGRNYSLNYAASTKAEGLLHNLVLRDGDVVHIPASESNFVYLVGDVRSARSIRVRSGSMTLTDALAGAGGINAEGGRGDKVYIFRGATRKPQVFKLNAKSPTAFLLASDFVLEPEDVIFVGPAEIAKWNRVLRNLFGSVQFIDSVNDTRNSF